MDRPRPRKRYHAGMSVPRSRLLVVLLLAAAAGGCGRGPRHEEVWQDAGFIRHLPGSTEAVVSLHGTAGTWAPLVTAGRALLADPGLQAAWARTPAGRVAGPFLASPPVADFLGTLASSPHGEAFLAFGSGTASQLAALQQVQRLFAAARVRNLFTPEAASDLVPPEAASPGEEIPENLAEAAFTEVIVPLPPAMQEALENFVRHAAVPPVVAGFKLAPHDLRLPDLLESWARNLPDGIPRDQIDAGEQGPFTRVRLPVVSLVPREAAVRARDVLAANIGDPYAATGLIRDLLAKTTTLCFGRAHGYFLVTAGLEDPRGAWAADFADSLPAGGALDRLVPGPESGASAIVYADALVVSLAAAPPPVAEYLDAALESALEFAPAAKIRTLREAAAPLRRQAEELFHPRVAPLAGVVRRADGRWEAELFGGSLAPRLASVNATPLLGADDKIALLWNEHWEAGYAARLARFLAGVTAFAEAWLDALGPLFLADGARDRSGRLLGLLSETTAPLRGDGAGLFGKAFDPQVALAVGFEESPLPEMALGAGLRNHEAWQELRAAVAAGPADLDPAVAIRDRRWVLGSSTSFARLVADLPAPQRHGASVQSVRLALTPVARLAAAWADALQHDPSIAALTADLFPSDPATLRSVAQLLETGGHLAYEARWDGEVLHRSITLDPSP